MNLEIDQDRKVAIWGSYHNGNFGDDLMAILLARRLRAQGYQPWVFRLSPRIARMHGLVSVDRLDELLDGAGCCVLGGGAFLTSDGAEVSFYANLLRDLSTLELELTKRQIPIVGISLGGAGFGYGTDIPSVVWRVMNNPLFQGTSVRLPGEVSMLLPLGKPVEYYPDVVLTASELAEASTLPVPRTSDVLVQYHRSCKTVLLIGGVVRLARATGRRIRFVRTQLPENVCDYRELGGPPAMLSGYRSPSGLLQDLAATGMVVSHKLHLGVAAVSLGKCFVSLGGREKTAAFLNSIDRASFYVPKQSIFTLIRLLLSRHVCVRYEERFRLPDLAGLRFAAARHYEFMFRRMETCWRKTPTRATPG
jgi:hypothetical protein